MFALVANKLTWHDLCVIVLIFQMNYNKINQTKEKTMTLNNSYAPSSKDISAHVATLATEEEKLNYLSEVASWDFKCPDACARWAQKWLEENE